MELSFLWVALVHFWPATLGALVLGYLLGRCSLVYLAPKLTKGWSCALGLAGLWFAPYLYAAPVLVAVSAFSGETEGLAQALVASFCLFALWVGSLIGYALPFVIDLGRRIKISA